MSQSTDLAKASVLPEPITSPIESMPHIIVGLSALVSSRRTRRFNIAILTRSRVAGIRQVIEGLMGHTNMYAPTEFSYTWFTGENDEKKLMDHAVHVIQHYAIPYDAIVTIGGMATQVASRISLLLNIRIPIIFTSVTHPSQLGILYAGCNGRQNITGISLHDTAFATPATMLQSLKKTVRNVLMPYDPFGDTSLQRVSEMARSFLNHNIQSHLLPIPKSEMVTSQISSLIHNVDTVLTLRNEVILIHMPAIVTMCNDFGVTIFSTDLASVEQGAAIGFSPKEQMQGIEAAQYLMMIFRENIRPEELPVKVLPMINYLGVNESALEKQGITISSKELDNIENKIVYRKED